MQWSLLAAVTLLRATHASEPALRVDAASGVVRATLRKGESMTANSACVVGCSGRASSGRLLRSTPLVALGPQEALVAARLAAQEGLALRGLLDARGRGRIDGVEQPRRPRGVYCRRHEQHRRPRGAVRAVRDAGDGAGGVRRAAS